MANIRMPGRGHTVHKTRSGTPHGLPQKTYCGLTVDLAAKRTSSAATCGRCLRSWAAEQKKKANAKVAKAKAAKKKVTKTRAKAAARKVKTARTRGW